LSASDTGVVTLHPFLDDGGPVPIAHRGGAGSAPENTLPAFQHAVDLGYRYVETDVHVTADGVLVAFHDSRLDRVTDRVGLISELTWSEVSQAKVDGIEPIPRFDELMRTFPQLKVNIDPKSDEAVGPLVRALRRLDALDRVCVGSFSDARLAQLHDELGTDLCVSAGPRETLRLRLASLGLPFRRFRAHCAQVPTHRSRVPIVDSRFVERLHDLGMHVHVWTVDEPAEMHRLLDLGVDGIMTDLPAVLLDVFTERGLAID
jgi:glycerophosphoryl diester phosphodiesterase